MKKTKQGDLQANLQIGEIKFNNPFFLAPLAGITDTSFRALCKEQGAAMVYSEMVSGKGLWYKDKNTETLLKILETEKPIGFQIFGKEPEIMAFTAATLEEREHALLDINMGCPVPKIVKNGEGSALLKEMDLAGRIVEACTSNSSKPVTAKIRIGWDSENINGVEMAKTLESAGASAIAVHGRTREQYYTGKANWDIIAAIKNAISIPVIGNGDISSGQDAIDLMDQTGCDFVMIGRGSLGNPWIFRDCVCLWEGRELGARVSPVEKLAMIKRHLDLIINTKGENVGIREMRKHIAWYLKGIRDSAQLRRKINSIGTVKELQEELLRFQENLITPRN